MAKRANNFNSNEIKELLEIVSTYKDVLENKRTDRVTVEDKNKAWKSIEKDFNAMFPEVFRAEKVLRTKYTNLKRDAKKNYAAGRREMYKTGGGNACTTTTTEDEMVMSICQSQQIQGDIAVYDDDVVEDGVIEELLENTCSTAERSKVQETATSPHTSNTPANAKPRQQHTDSWSKLLKKPINKNLRFKSADSWSALAEKKSERQISKQQQQKEEHELRMQALRAQIEQSQEEHKLKMELLRLQITEQNIKNEKLLN